MKVDAWWYSFIDEPESNQSGSLSGAIAQALEQDGVALKAYNARSGGQIPGLVILAGLKPGICEWIRRASRDGSERVLALTPQENSLHGQDAWRLMQAGASDVLAWDSLSDPGAVVAARLQRWMEVDGLVASPLVRNNLVGESRPWRQALRQVVEVARFSASPVLLSGETGTGKELAARLIHTLEPQRSARDLVVLDCTTIVPDLSGSELFGHERGAFTGAVSQRDGAFALADGGTLFLDEVGELPLALQVQLLRVLQEHTYKRVGSNTWHKSDFRLVCATNRNLQDEVAAGRFRQDLYYRIASWSINLPPLRERSADILPLVRHFMREIHPEAGEIELDSRLSHYFLTRPYTGNIRDLKNLVYRIAARHVGAGPVTIGDIPPDERPQHEDAHHGWYDQTAEQVIRQALARGIPLRELKREIEDAAIRIVVEQELGNLQRAAQRLGVCDRKLQAWRASNGA